MECRLTRETEVLLGEKLPQRHFCPSQNPTRLDPGLNPGRCGEKPATKNWFFFFNPGLWGYWHCDHSWSIVPASGDRWWWLWRNWLNRYWQGKPKYSEKTCPITAFPTTNPTWLDPGLNPGRRGGKPAINRLRYGAADCYTLYISEDFQCCLTITSACVNT
jgi:hypothetical protein